MALFAAWLLLSGHSETMLFTFGGLSCAAVVAIALRMDVVDHEGQPVHLGWRLVPYLLWLMWQIVLANWDVAKRILNPHLPISPRVIEVEAGQETELGQVIYANSITLTPGTVSMAVRDGVITVHALSAEAAEDVESGDMNRRVSRLEEKS